MLNVLWRIASQAVSIKDPEGAVVQTLVFDGDLNGAHQQRLRLIPSDPEAEVIELEFATGGGLIDGPYYQPRYLKPFERPDLHNPNVRKNVAFRRHNWEAGQNGNAAVSPEEWDEQYHDEAVDADGNAVAHPLPTDEAVKAAEEKSKSAAVAQQTVRDTQLAQGLPVSPAPHLETPYTVTIPARPDEGVPGDTPSGALPTADTTDPLRGEQARRAGASRSPADGPDPTPPKGVTTAASMQP